MTENDFTQSVDAVVWAREFVRRVRENPAIPTDEGTMIGWMANAIMRGYDTGYSKGHHDCSMQYAGTD